MAVVITPQAEIDAYYADDSLSQSEFKKLLGGIDNFVATTEEEQDEFGKKPAIKIGSAVDCILTGEEGEFDKQFVVAQVDKMPSEAIVKMVEMVHNQVLSDYDEYLTVNTPVNESITVTQDAIIVEQGSLEDTQEIALSFEGFAGILDNWDAYILEAATNTGWNPKWGDEAKLKNIKTVEAIAYFKLLSTCYGRKVLTITEYETVKSIVASLRGNFRTAMYFDREKQAQNDAFTFYYQFPIYFEYRGIKCKALLDLVAVAREESGRIISVQAIDLKTMAGNTYNFIHSIKQRRYDIQAAWYMLALRDYFALENDSASLFPFRFVVESTTRQGKPLHYECNYELLNIGRYGRPAVKMTDVAGLFAEGAFDNETSASSIIMSKEILGFDQLIDIYIYHNENGWFEEREIQEAGEAAIIIGWEGIVK